MKPALKTYVYYKPLYSRKTGRALADALGAISGSKGACRADVLIRWGNTDAMVYKPKMVLNSREAVTSCVDKTKQMEILDNAGINIPRETTKVPLVIKPQYHMKGEGIHFIDSQDEFDGDYIHPSSRVEEWIPKLREFRVHVVCGRFLVDEKIPDKKECLSNPIWNFENGFKFKRAILDETVVEAIYQAKRAVMALGLNIGAVDVAIDKRNNEPVVFEVNSAPSLREQHIERYVAILHKVIKNMRKEMKGFKNIFENEV